ncbi:L-histidine N(alpha)-methyltransferase [Marinimicrobium agarilyticum]|uniref:L-histidine N(alpha)-methyltransferase n=1 Tax=Marinimicrobium agarilyticum TaxID=306546 RepID=UPI000420A344|nr:L-histidine N(alpha)-methyltransferase [Marinimicrobium agarilyticum]
MKATHFYDFSPKEDSFRSDVLKGLSLETKTLSPKYFYDQRGSELFEQICQQPEYYPTDTEIGILHENRTEIAQLSGTGCELVEFGCGASKKIRVLLEGLRPKTYIGVDISREFLIESTNRLSSDYPWLEVHGLCADLCEPITLAKPSDGQRIGFYPGSSIGNFEPDDAIEMLRNFKSLLGPGGTLLIGVDLKKDDRILTAAYNDSADITAQFNLNVLERMKGELGAVVDTSAFEHRAFYNERLGRIEMHLVSTQPQRIEIDGEAFLFEEGESIHTESSYKYTVSEFQALCWRAGYEALKCWTDDDALFSVHLLRVTGG